MKLRRAVEKYIALRRALGERCITNARQLRAFCRFVGPATPLSGVRTDDVTAFLNGEGPITSTWFVKHNALVVFFRYAVSRGHLKSAPLPAIKPKRPPAFVPYIFSRDELRRLVRATDTYQKCRSCMEPITVRLMLLLSYATALRASEAIALNRTDVDLPNCLLTVRRTKFYKTRLVPFAAGLRWPLEEYVQRSRAGAEPSVAEPFFTTMKGTRVVQGTLDAIFHRLRENAGIRRADGARYQPRLHDLRHSAAVHRVIDWYRRGLDVNRMLPRLSVYMGHSNLDATQLYLTMTAELLREAGRRFERFYCEDSYET